jgi:ferredoxin-type protein NapG/ferredoxin-type protein NapH
MKRRELLVALGATSLLSPRAVGQSRLRPPGALAPGDFEHACIGCTRCAEVCPPRAIRLERGLPYVEPRESACTLCMKCPPVCPTGALLPLTAERVRMGTPALDRRRCLPWSGAGTCRLCYYVCPYPDRAVELVGAQAGPLFHPDACVGCGLCEEACPDTAAAIHIVPK